MIYLLGRLHMVDPLDGLHMVCPIRGLHMVYQLGGLHMTYSLGGLHTKSAHLADCTLSPPTPRAAHGLPTRQAGLLTRRTVHQVYPLGGQHIVCPLGGLDIKSTHAAGCTSSLPTRRAAHQVYPLGGLHIKSTHSAGCTSSLPTRRAAHHVYPLGGLRMVCPIVEMNIKSIYFNYLFTVADEITVKSLQCQSFRLSVFQAS